MYVFTSTSRTMWSIAFHIRWRLNFTYISQVWKQHDNRARHFFLHGHNTETYYQCCEFLHICSFILCYFLCSKTNWMQWEQLQIPQLENHLEMFLTEYVIQSSEGFIIRFLLFLLTNVKMMHINSSIILPIENMWPQWTKVILELLGWKHTDKYESYSPNMLPESSFSIFILKQNK